ncbi:unnamed protein product [Soboliphyme baturini]|uniref:Phospholipase A2 n=1 Tax=Soboliphyme baturini TaxID=241478 RepID=A0A3P8CMK9_9BILA|nr:unnamed protein product [Soboliphyme baturini]
MVRPKRWLKDFAGVIKCVTGRNALDYNGYGCWCGMGGHGTPVDAIDRCCQQHDHCYDMLAKKDCAIYVTPYNWNCVNHDIRCAGELPNNVYSSLNEKFRNHHAHVFNGTVPLRHTSRSLLQEEPIPEEKATLQQLKPSVRCVSTSIQRKILNPFLNFPLLNCTMICGVVFSDFLRNCKCMMAVCVIRTNRFKIQNLWHH